MIRFILLRGLGREQQHWGELPALLQQSFPNAQIDTPDLAGAGVLNDVSSPLKIEDYIPFLTEQISPLQVVNKVVNNNNLQSETHTTVLIGLSLGGMIGLHWYAHYPEFFNHLVLINSSSQLNHFYERIKLPKVMSELSSLLSSDSEEGEIARYHLTCNKEPIDPEIIDTWVKIQKEHPVKLTNITKQLCAASLFTPPSLQSISDNKNITIFAAKQDQLVNVCCSEALAEHYQVPIVYHDWAGHDIPQDDPKWICQQLTTILSPSEQLIA